MTIDYQSRSFARLSPVAVTAMVFGVAALPASLFILGILLGWIALILGIIAYYQIKSRPEKYAGMGYAKTGIVLGVLAGFVIGPIMLPSIGRETGGSNRAACAANLNGIAKGMLVYANENSDVLPCVWAGPTATPMYHWGGTAGRTEVDAQNAIHTAAAGDPTAGFWMLVLQNSISPRSLLCKSDPFAASSASTVQDSAGNWRIAPSSANNLSYSAAIPWAETDAKGGTAGNWWHDNPDSSLPILSDMVLPSTTLGTTGAALKRINSANHNGDGQNIAYGDAHVEWTRTPLLSNGDDVRYYNKGPLPGSGSEAATLAYPTFPLDNAAAPYNIMMAPQRDASGTIR